MNRHTATLEHHIKIATHGSSNRGQPQRNIDISAFLHLPEGPVRVRSSAIVRILCSAEIDFKNPIRHGFGNSWLCSVYIPIHRYMDLLAHYQVKAFLGGESPPFSAGQLEEEASI
ncbi:hypothetical protein SLE2022_075520 [Rubroshorea leprosula]